jgi:hypothetical protein
VTPGTSVAVRLDSDFNSGYARPSRASNFVRVSVTKAMPSLSLLVMLKAYALFPARLTGE